MKPIIPIIPPVLYGHYDQKNNNTSDNTQSIQEFLPLELLGFLMILVVIAFIAIAIYVGLKLS